MQAGVIRGKGNFELADVAEPEAEEGQAVVDITLCGICGSDVHAYVEGWPYAPGLCGHEWVGVVRAVAPGVTSVVEGDRVMAGQAGGCGLCAPCRSGTPEYCKVARAAYTGQRGPANGGFARSMALDANRLCRLPDDVDDISGAMVEPASVALHGVRKSRLRVGDVACVVGCGPIGLLAVQCARIAGAGVVIAVEPDESRRARSLAVGATAAFAPGAELFEYINNLTNGLRADIAFDCAGVPQTLQRSVDLVRRGGSVCMIGVSGGEATVVPMRWLDKEVTVDTSMLFTLEEAGIAAGFIADGRLNVKPLHDATISLGQLGQTIDDLANRRLSAVKVLVDPKLA